MYRSNYLGNEAACLCPATETTCAKDRKCWWYEVGWSQMNDDFVVACGIVGKRFFYSASGRYKRFDAILCLSQQRGEVLLPPGEASQEEGEK